MYLYKEKSRFSPDTGKPTMASWIKEPDILLCDFTGEEINIEDFEDRPSYTLKFEYDDGCEQAWYYDDVEKVLELLEPDFDDYYLRGLLAEQEFHFKILNSNFEDASLLLAREWIENVQKKKHILYDCRSLGEAARIWRKKIVIDLLKKSKYKPGQLGLIKAF